MDNEFILMDRIQKIKQIISQYGEDNFYISFSGGYDSTVLHYLVDMAIPENTIPRVYANTGIEYNKIIEFVEKLKNNDNRFIILKPELPIKPTLEKYGYPFKSKKHSALLKVYQKYKTTDGRTGIQHYLHISNDGKEWSPAQSCPQKLKFQFSPDYDLKISDDCCTMLKEKPLKKWQKENNRKYAILGLMREEGGRRFNAHCLRMLNGELKTFQPLVAITKEWEKWFIDKYNLEVCELYNEPYNFKRTGCKGCPFALKLEEELETLEKFFPAERKQCEIIWKPVYDEYRRINYRLKGENKNEG